uniref:DUF2793 domain-containing protein n=1 Tax=Parerythrobacter lutipelagi TaxID=1964208 RepID=UPI001375D8B0|nr:DUF2793 domain-containing protein [Parerythrobacter lutipelagi]
MSEPIQFTDTSARFGLPFLRAGQSQKEFFVNEAFTLSDFLHHTSILGVLQSPPATPTDGDVWLIENGATAEWTGQDGKLAGWFGNVWHYIAPSAGMRVFDQAAGQFALFSADWQYAARPAAVVDGPVIDAELRAAFNELIEALGTAGVFPVTA